MIVWPQTCPGPTNSCSDHVSFISEFLTIGCSWWGLSECLTECRVAERCDHWQEARDDRRLTVGFRTQGTVTRKRCVEFSRTKSGRIMQERAIWPETWPHGERLGSLLGILLCVETLSYIGVPVLKASWKPTPYPHQNQNLGHVALEYLMSWPTFCACGCHSGLGYVVIGYRLCL